MIVERISVFGLGKLGSTMVGCFASCGFDVIGVDIIEDSVRKVAQGRAPVPEPGLQDLYDAHRSRIQATMNPADAVLGSDASFIIVPTPSTATGQFSARMSRAVALQIGKALAGKDDYHLVVLTSTVLPGMTDREIRTALEDASGKVCGRDFGLCYSPEFIAIGDVINGLLHPDFFLIGEFDRRSGDILESLYRREGGRDAAVARMSLANAELTKIAVNTFVTAKISFANTLSRLCSRIPDGDAYAVARAVGMDKRVGNRYLMPGPAFGGPCFPRDNRAFGWFAQSVGEEAPIAEATDRVNRSQILHLQQLVESSTPPGGRAAVLGLSYKPRTGLLEESMAVALTSGLIRNGSRVRVFDPWASAEDISKVLAGAEIAASVSECVTGADVIVLATEHDEFKDLRLADLRVLAPAAGVVDLWGKWRLASVPAGMKYTFPGRGPASKA